jgi:nucleotidyltransferase/DNA polymerase involved in DNA repair
MKRVLCVWLPRWPLEQLLDARPELKASPFARTALVLYEQQPRAGLRVVACSPQAAARGIRTGMPLAEAAALSSTRATTGRLMRVPGVDGHRVLVVGEPPAAPSKSDVRQIPANSANFHAEPYDPLAAREALAHLAAWCEQFSPTVGLEDSPRPESLLVDATGLAPLFHGEEALVKQVARAFAGRGFTARLALADTIGAAWAVARYGEGGTRKVEGGGGSKERGAESGERGAGSKEREEHKDLPSPLRGRGARGEGEPQVWSNPQVPLPSAFHFPPSAFTIIPPGETRAALAPLPLAALRLSEGCVSVLRELGLTRIGQLASLERADLAARFGEELLLRYDQAMGQAAEVIAVGQLPPELEREFSFEQPIARYELVEAVLARQLAELTEALAAERRGVQSLRCRLQSASGAAVSVSLGLFRPSAVARHLLELVRMRLERLTLTDAVTSVQVRVTATAPLECRQRELFADGSQREDPRHLAALVDRLSSRLGRDRVLRPVLASDAQPEYAWRCEPLVGGKLKSGERGVRSGERWKRRARLRPAAKRSSSGAYPIRNPPSAIRNFAHRPLRLTAQPVELVVVSIVPDGPPLRFQLGGQEHRVARFWGPERIETGWWRGQPVRRDYYRVETAAGLRHWLFRRLYDGQWFWQGDFD